MKQDEGYSVVLFMKKPCLIRPSVFQAKDEVSLRGLATKLTEENIDHKLWIEQPENIPTCIATKPYPKDQVQKYFKKFKLFK